LNGETKTYQFKFLNRLHGFLANLEFLNHFCTIFSKTWSALNNIYTQSEPTLYNNDETNEPKRVNGFLWFGFTYLNRTGSPVFGFQSPQILDHTCPLWVMG